VGGVPREVVSFRNEDDTAAPDHGVVMSITAGTQFPEQASITQELRAAWRSLRERRLP
jgi:hypothetical protein